MKGQRIIDLTQSINTEMPGVAITTARTLSEDGWNATTLALYSHSGTHMDAPLHFGVSSQSIDELPVDRMVSEAWVVDLTTIKPKEKIEIAHFEPIASQLKRGDSVLLHTGWSKRVGTEEYRDALPRISRDLAFWLGEMEINILGVEPPSVADVNNLEEVTEIHKILMSNDIIIAEGLTNLDALSQQKITLVALPLKVERGDGAPARIIAIEN